MNLLDIIHTNYPMKPTVISPLTFKLQDETTADDWALACLELFGSKAQTHRHGGKLVMDTFLISEIPQILHIILGGRLESSTSWIQKFIMRSLKVPRQREPLSETMEEAYDWFMSFNVRRFLPTKFRTKRKIQRHATKAIEKLNFGQRFTLCGACKNVILASLVSSNSTDAEEQTLINSLQIPWGLKQILIRGLTTGLDAANCKVYKLLIETSTFN